MPIDASIPLGVRTDYGSSIDTAAKAMTLKHLMKQDAQADALAPLQMQSAQLDVNAKTAEAKEKDAIVSAYHDSWDATQNKTDNIKLMGLLHERVPVYAEKWATDKFKTDAEFAKQIQDAQKNFTSAAGPLFKRIVDDNDNRVKGGMPADAAWAAVKPQAAAAMKMLSDAKYPSMFLVDPEKMTIDQARSVANSWDGSLKLDQEREKAAADASYRDRMAGAAEMRARRTGLGENNEPANIAEWNAYERMTPEQKKEYLIMKRSNPYVNLGDQMVQPDPTNAGQALGSFDVAVSPDARPETRAAQTKAVAEATTAATRKASSFGQDVLLDEAEALLNSKSAPTGSGAGALADKAASLVGATPAGAGEADQLEIIAGSLVSKVPRMEGPQSNYDVENYKKMAGDLGNRTLPVERRLMALKTLRSLTEKYAALNKAETNSDDDLIGKYLRKGQ